MLALIGACPPRYPFPRACGPSFALDVVGGRRHFAYWANFVTSIVNATVAGGVLAAYLIKHVTYKRRWAHVHAPITFTPAHKSHALAAVTACGCA